jgi:hypothetical protein
MPKKEDIFFTMLKQVAAQLLDASVEYASIMREYPESITRIPRMKVHETTTDELVADIHKQLYTSFITPIEREDISDLALRMDDVVDLMEVVCMRLDLFGIEQMRPEAVEMAELTCEAVWKPESLERSEVFVGTVTSTALLASGASAVPLTLTDSIVLGSPPSATRSSTRPSSVSSAACVAKSCLALSW